MKTILEDCRGLLCSFSLTGVWRMKCVAMTPVNHGGRMFANEGKFIDCRYLEAKVIGLPRNASDEAALCVGRVASVLHHDMFIRPAADEDYILVFEELTGRGLYFGIRADVDILIANHENHAPVRMEQAAGRLLMALGRESIRVYDTMRVGDGVSVNVAIGGASPRGFEDFEVVSGFTATVEDEGAELVEGAKADGSTYLAIDYDRETLGLNK